MEDAEMQRLWSPGGKRFSHQGWKGQFLHKVFSPTLRESEQGFTLCRGRQGGLQAESEVNRGDDIAAGA